MGVPVGDRADFISVIMPAFNAEPTIEASIRSALEQGHRGVEVIVADDGSTDRTCEVIGRMIEGDRRVRLVRTAGRQGPALARNAAIAASSAGRWLAFLDSDDLWHPDKLSLQLRLAQRSGSPLIFSGYWRISEDGRLAGRPVRVPGSLRYGDLLGNSAIATSTVLLDRDRFGPIRLEAGVGYDDFELWTRLLATGAVARSTAEPLMAYRVRQNSVSRRRVKMSREVWRVLREYRRVPLPIACVKFASYALRGAVKHRIARPCMPAGEVLPAEVMGYLPVG